MSVSKEELVEALSSMSIIEVTELVSELEEKWGVSAASAVAMAPAAAGDAGAAEEKDEGLGGGCIAAIVLGYDCHDILSYVFFRSSAHEDILSYVLALEEICSKCPHEEICQETYGNT